MKTFYMHHYLCIVQCVDEKKIRCTLLNINAKQRNAKIIIKKQIQIIFLVRSYFGVVVVSFIHPYFLSVHNSNMII